MLVTLFLISSNVYNSLDVPSNTGFCYLEVWFIGAQIPITLAILEYGMILYLKKKSTFKLKDMDPTKKEVKLELMFHKMDMYSLIGCLIFFFCFTIIYCGVTSSI